MSAQNEQQKTPAPPTLCTAGCGFYSNVGTGGLCSKCFRDQHQQEQAAAALVNPPPPPPAVLERPPSPAPSASSTEAAAAPVEEVAVPSSSSAAAAATPVAVAVAEAAPEGPPAKRPSPTRCWTCNKKVGLTGFSCKCEPEGAVFCSTHRYAEAHACSFDYRTAAQKRLEASNPLVQASKVQKL